MFARLAELDLMAAEKAHAKFMAAEETSDIAELGRTYQRMARSLRQTLALKAKLAREREAAEAAAAETPPPPLIHEGLRTLDGATRAHIERVRDAAMPYLERERPDWDDSTRPSVYVVLIALAEDDETFVETPVEAFLARVLEIMEVPPSRPNLRRARRRARRPGLRLTAQPGAKRPLSEPRNTRNTQKRAGPPPPAASPPARPFVYSCIHGSIYRACGAQGDAQLPRPSARCSSASAAAAKAACWRSGRPRRSDGQHRLDRPGHRHAGVAGRVAVAVARRPRRARFSECPRSRRTARGRFGPAAARRARSPSACPASASRGMSVSSTRALGV